MPELTSTAFIISIKVLFFLSAIPLMYKVITSWIILCSTQNRYLIRCIFKTSIKSNIFFYHAPLVPISLALFHNGLIFIHRLTIQSFIVVNLVVDFSIRSLFHCCLEHQLYIFFYFIAQYLFFFNYFRHKNYCLFGLKIESHKQ